jgi:curved DNA-binding protein CbpA
VSTDHYETLGVPEDASQEQIKRAYYRLVRQYPPEKEPEKFKVIREAYEILSDPKARDNYNAMQRHGEEVHRLFGEAETLMAEDRWEEAQRPLKRILLVIPAADAALNSLGICYLNLADWANAIKVYDKLTTRSPDVPVYWSNYGMAYYEQTEDMSDHDHRKSLLLNNARSKFKRARDLEPYNVQHYISLSRTYVREKDYTQAEYWLEQGITADGKTDTSDFEILFELCIVYLYAGKLNSIAQTASRIIAMVPPEDDEFRKYASARFGVLGHELFQLRAFREALTFLNASERFDPGNEDLKEFAQSVRSIMDARDQFDRLKNDPQVCGPVKAFCAYYVAGNSGEFEDETQEDTDRIFEDVVRGLDTVHPSMILSSVVRVRTSYPAIYGINASAFGEVERVASESSRLSGTSSTGAVVKSGCFVVTATYGTPYAPQVARFRQFRDEFLLTHPPGRAFVCLYYRWGPCVATLVRRHPRLKRLFACGLGFLIKYLPKKAE